ncbi:MAG: hypothetical protein KDB03_04450 [Planctomycetales bacterium]|nr:hypothetical protein [Planctomycetales bacterium]
MNAQSRIVPADGFPSWLVGGLCAGAVVQPLPTGQFLGFGEEQLGQLISASPMPRSE